VGTLVLFGSESWFDLCYVMPIFGISNIEKILQSS